MGFPFLDTATELLTEVVLPLLDAADVVALGRTCKQLHALILDRSNPEAEFIWKTRIKRDLRFPVESTARQSGWLELYRRIRRPHVYLWGEGRNGRLAIERNDARVKLLARNGCLPIPARLPINVPIIDLVAGGWSFHALSVNGKIYHWGQLDGGSFAPYRPASTSAIPLTAYPGAMVPVVTQFAPRIPPISRMLSGRLHMLALDERGRLWTWGNWAEAGLVSSPWLDYSQHRIVDIAAGWTFSAVLLEDRRTKRASIQVWWQRFLSPTLESSTRRQVPHDGDIGPRPVQGRQGCFDFELRQTIKLPDLPNTDEGDRIEKLSAGEAFLVILTEHGRVYKFDLSAPQPPMWGGGQGQGHLQGLIAPQNEEEEEIEDGRLLNRTFTELERQIMTGQRHWIHLEKFSNWHLRSSRNETAPGTQVELDEESSNSSLQTCNQRISFISANFRTFFCIGGGAVLQGHQDATEESEPTVMPELQNRGVIRVECGDYHFGALTASGELYTFGGYSNGALGLGIENSRLEPPLRGPIDRTVRIPSRVSFLEPSRADVISKPDEFCFNLAMAGWASGALCVNLNDEVDEEGPEGDVRSFAGKGKEREKDQNADDADPSTSRCSTGEMHEANEVIEAQDDQSIGSHRRLSPGIFRGAAVPFRVGYPGRGGRAAGHGGYASARSSTVDEG